MSWLTAIRTSLQGRGEYIFELSVSGEHKVGPMGELSGSPTKSSSERLRADERFADGSRLSHSKSFGTSKGFNLDAGHAASSLDEMRSAPQGGRCQMLFAAVAG